MKDNLGDRMKGYESMESGRRCMSLLPILARIDRKNFSRFTRNMDRPYDIRLSQRMIETTKHLVKESNARIGYTQSDEISLLFYSDNTKEQV